MSVNIYGSTNAATGIAVNPTQVGQAAAYQASEYAAQAARNVPVQGGSTLFDITMGRVGAESVRQTPTTQSGSPVVPTLQAQFQMARDFRPFYSVDAHSLTDMPALQDSLTLAGTKWAGASRDSYLAPQVPIMRASAYETNVDPIMSCAPGEQKLLPGSAGGAGTAFYQIPETYNKSALIARSNLVPATTPYELGHSTFAAAYNPSAMQAPRMMPPTMNVLASPGLGFHMYNPQGQTQVSMGVSGAAPGIFGNPASALLSPSSFANGRMQIP
jgi:hypothetical protein